MPTVPKAVHETILAKSKNLMERIERQKTVLKEAQDSLDAETIVLAELDQQAKQLADWLQQHCVAEPSATAPMPASAASHRAQSMADWTLRNG